MSDWDNPSDYGEQFLRANANPDYIAAQFADVLRDMMRAFAADDPTAGVSRASSHLSMMFQLIARAPDPINAYSVCQIAVEDLRENRPTEYGREDPWSVAARSGLKMLVEQSCFDNAARGRTSKRQEAFARDIGAIGRRLKYYLED